MNQSRSPSNGIAGSTTTHHRATSFFTGWLFWYVSAAGSDREMMFYRLENEATSKLKP